MRLEAKDLGVRYALNFLHRVSYVYEQGNIFERTVVVCWMGESNVLRIILL